MLSFGDVVFLEQSFVCQTVWPDIFQNVFDYYPLLEPKNDSNNSMIRLDIGKEYHYSDYYNKAIKRLVEIFYEFLCEKMNCFSDLKKELKLEKIKSLVLELSKIPLPKKEDIFCIPEGEFVVIGIESNYHGGCKITFKQLKKGVYDKESICLTKWIDSKYLSEFKPIRRIL